MRLRFCDCGRFAEGRIHNHRDERKPLVETGFFCPLDDIVFYLAIEDIADLIVGFVFVKDLVVIREIARNLVVLKILRGQIYRNIDIVFLIEQNHAREVDPSARRYEALSLRR